MGILSQHVWRLTRVEDKPRWFFGRNTEKREPVLMPFLMQFRNTLIMSYYPADNKKKFELLFRVLVYSLELDFQRETLYFPFSSVLPCIQTSNSTWFMIGPSYQRAPEGDLMNTNPDKLRYKLASQLISPSVKPGKSDPAGRWSRILI